MICRALAVFVILALAACSGHDLPKPEGTPFAFNPGLWQPTAADMNATASAGQP